MIKYIDLYDYQKELVSKMGTSKCIWLPPSKGKTITSLWAYKLYGRGRLLILCPASMVKEWETELKNMNITDYDIYSFNKLCYDNYMSEIIKTQYHTCIIDEHQHINNVKNKSTKQILKKVDTIKIKYLLSATPSGNYEWKDLYVAFRIIKGYGYMSYNQYRKRYFIETPSRWNKYVMDIVGYRNTEELMELKQSISLIYNSEHKAKIIEQVIDTTTFTNKFQMKDYNRILRQKYYKDYLLDSTAKVSYFKRMFASGILLNNDEDSYSYELFSTKRLDELYKLLMKHKNDNILVFYNYKNEYDIISSYLKEKNIDFVHFESSKDTNKIEPSKVNIVSYAVGSEGLNKFKDCIVYISFSLPYSYIKWKQSKGRINRLDNYDTEYYYYFVNGIDEKVYDTIKRGKSFSDKLMEKTNCVLQK